VAYGFIVANILIDLPHSLFQDILDRAARQDQALLRAWLPGLRAELARLLPGRSDGGSGSSTDAGPASLTAEQPPSVALLRGLTLLAEAQLPKDVQWLPDNLQTALPQMCAPHTHPAAENQLYKFII
jgi:hypothetical protein